MSSPKSLAARKPCGRIANKPRDTELMSPTEVKRIIDASAAGMRDSLWGSSLGRLQLTSKISRSEFAAGEHWAALLAEYANATCAPDRPRTVSLDPTGGTMPDPDSEVGNKQARRDARVVQDFLEGHFALREAGRDAEHAVTEVCEYDRAPTGWAELENLRTGLRALSGWWSSLNNRNRKQRR